MLRSECGREVLGTANPPVRRRRASGPEAEPRLKGGHRLPSAIVTKHELVQVDLELRRTNPVVRADQPLLQMARSASGTTEGTPPRRAVRTRLSAADVPDPSGVHPVKVFQTVTVNRRTRCDVLLDDREDRRLFDVRDDGHPHPTRDVAAFLDRDKDHGGLYPVTGSDLYRRENSGITGARVARVSRSRARRSSNCRKKICGCVSSWSASSASAHGWSARTLG